MKVINRYYDSMYQSELNKKNFNVLKNVFNEVNNERS